jgi:hypothetical protein
MRHWELFFHNVRALQCHQVYLTIGLFGFSMNFRVVIKRSVADPKNMYPVRRTVNTASFAPSKIFLCVNLKKNVTDMKS